MHAPALQPAISLTQGLSLDLVRVTEAAAIAASAWRGRGDERSADIAAATAMRHELDRLPVNGRVVLGEGDEPGSPLPHGTEVGSGGPAIDIAVDPLEGATLAAKAAGGALSVGVFAEAGALLPLPDIYMDKLAVGPGYPAGVVDIGATPADNLGRLAAAKGVALGELTVCILDRPRHAALIAAVRAAGAAVKLIGDGDIAAIIEVVTPAETHVDV